jgi:hypothetical protein
MSKLTAIVTLTGLIAANAALAQTAVPDLRGTWKGKARPSSSERAILIMARPQELRLD